MGLAALRARSPSASLRAGSFAKGAKWSGGLLQTKKSTQNSKAADRNVRPTQTLGSHPFGFAQGRLFRKGREMVRQPLANEKIANTGLVATVGIASQSIVGCGESHVIADAVGAKNTVLLRTCLAGVAD